MAKPSKKTNPVEPKKSKPKSPSSFPRLTRAQARAVKAVADRLTKAEEVYAEGQKIVARGTPKAKIRVLSPEEQMMRHWAVYDGIINGTVNARTGMGLLEHGPLGQLRLVEARERDNGRRKRTRTKIPTPPTTKP